MSPTRRFRLVRTGVIAVVVLALAGWGLSRCGGDDPAPRSAATTTTTKKSGRTSTTVAGAAGAQSVTVTALSRKLPAAHYQTGATVVDGKVILMGGLDANKSSTDVVWRFDPTTGATTNLGHLPRPLYGPAVATVAGAAYAFGGASAITRFDKVITLKAGAANGTDTSKKLPTPRADAGAVTLDDGRAVIVGGYDGTNPTNDVLVTSDGATFTTVGALAEPVRFPALVAVGSVVWVIGGTWQDVSTATVQKIDMATGQVTKAGTLPAPLSHAAAFALGGSIFVAGGRNANGRTDEISRFDPVAVTTTPVGKLPTKLSDSPVAVVGGAAYLLGGAIPAATASVLKITPT